MVTSTFLSPSGFGSILSFRFFSGFRFMVLRVLGFYGFEFQGLVFFLGFRFFEVSGLMFRILSFSGFGV